MKVRVYRSTDQSEIVNLWKCCNLVVPWNDPNKDIQRKLLKDPDLFLVGEVEGAIVASVIGGYDGHRGWINYLAVHPDQRKKGYGKKIMLKVESYLEKKGCPKINLQIRESNTEVILFYRSLGYEVDPVVSMGKRIQS